MFFNDWLCRIFWFGPAFKLPFNVFSETKIKTIDLFCFCFILLAVKGLLILATFPGGYSLISKTVFEKILVTFVSIINEEYSKRLSWKLALKALVEIGSFIERYHESEKEPSYMDIVVEKILSLAFVGDFGIPFPLRLEALSDIGTSGRSYMLKVVQGLEEAIYANLYEVYVCMANKLLLILKDNYHVKDHNIKYPYCGRWMVSSSSFSFS